MDSELRGRAAVTSTAFPREHPKLPTRERSRASRVASLADACLDQALRRHPRAAITRANHLPSCTLTMYSVTAKGQGFHAPATTPQPDHQRALLQAPGLSLQ